MFRSLRSFCALAALSSALFTSARVVAQDVAADAARVLGQLNTDGEILFYLNTRGDGSVLAGKMNELYAGIRQDMPQLAAQLPPLDFSVLTQGTGLEALHGLGYSSRWEADQGFYRNLAVIDLPQGPAGFFKLYGTENKPFTIAQLAPANASIVAEGEIHWTALREVVESIAVGVMGEGGKALIGNFLQQPLGASGLTGEALLQQLSTQTQVVAVLGYEEAEAGKPAQPHADFLMRFAGAGSVFDAIAQLKDSAPGISVADAADFGIMNLPMTGRSMGLSELVLLKDKTSGDLILCSGLPFVRRCLGLSTSLADTPEFRHYNQGLPPSGVFYTYISPEYGKWTLQSLQNEAGSGEGSG